MSKCQWLTFVYHSRLEIFFAPDLLFASVVVVGHSKSRPDLHIRSVRGKATVRVVDFRGSIVSMDVGSE